MNLKENLEKHTDDTPQHLFVNFTKIVSGFGCLETELPIVLNRMPEDDLIIWMVEFLRELISNEDVDFRVYGNCSLNNRLLPIQINIYSTRIDVSYIWQGCAIQKTYTLCSIIGPTASIKKFREKLIEQHSGEFYSPRENIFISKEK
jgi:hypothetical protein